MKSAWTMMLLATLALVVGCESSDKTAMEEETPPPTDSTSTETTDYSGIVESTPSTTTTTTSSEVIYVEPTPTTPPPSTTTSGTTTSSTGFPQLPGGIPQGPGPVIIDSAQPGGVYTIKKGDTLFSIAKRVYGSGNKWRDIQAANPGIVPTKLRVGQQINLPQ